MNPSLKSSILLITALLSFRGVHQVSASAAPPHAPGLSVHESLYGTETRGTKRLSVEKITIRLQSTSGADSPFVVQSFFLKKGSPGEDAVIDETVVFEVSPPFSSYDISARPITLSGSKKPSSKSGSSKKSSSKKSKPSKAPSNDFPREGFIVRVLSGGTVLRLHASSHPLERMAKEHPELLDLAANSKSARHPNSSTLLKK